MEESETAKTEMATNTVKQILKLHHVHICAILQARLLVAQHSTSIVYYSIQF